MNIHQSEKGVSLRTALIAGMLFLSLLCCLGCRNGRNPSGPTNQITTPSGVTGDPTWTKLPEAWVGELSVGR